MNTKRIINTVNDRLNVRVRAGNQLTMVFITESGFSKLKCFIHSLISSEYSYNCISYLKEVIFQDFDNSFQFLSGCIHFMALQICRKESPVILTSEMTEELLQIASIKKFASTKRTFNG